jgi:integrase/recombinase XerD
VLTVYRRHTRSQCRFTRRIEAKCRCPIWVAGLLPDGTKVKRALKIRDWARAQRLVRDWEVTNEKPKIEQRTTIEDWRDQFVQDCAGRHLASETVRKYKFLFKQLDAFAKGRAFFVSDFTPTLVSEFRASWKDGALSSAKKLERLRSIFRFAVERRWLFENPARVLKMPKVKMIPTLPFTDDEFRRIVKVCDKRLLAFVCVMRYAGLRISDTTTLRVDALTGNKLTLYTAKTGEPVRVALPPHSADQLRKIPHRHPDFFFWSGHSKVQAAASVWRKRLATAFKAAKIANGHTHRFRDTFAVGLLEGGLSIENLATLLGHSSIRVTEKHYAPWVKSRQDLLEREVERIHVEGIDFA